MYCFFLDTARIHIIYTYINIYKAIMFNMFA